MIVGWGACSKLLKSVIYIYIYLFHPYPPYLNWKGQKRAGTSSDDSTSFPKAKWHTRWSIYLYNVFLGRAETRRDCNESINKKVIQKFSTKGFPSVSSLQFFLANRSCWNSRRMLRCKGSLLLMWSPWNECISAGCWDVFLGVVSHHFTTRFCAPLQISFWVKLAAAKAPENWCLEDECPFGAYFQG